MTNLSELAARIEAAGADEQRALLIDAAFEIAGGNWPTAKAGQFLRMLDAEAYESAALMLVPEGYVFTVSDWWCDGGERPPYFADVGDRLALIDGDEVSVQQAWAATPALALACAALRAKEVSDHG